MTPFAWICLAALLALNGVCALRVVAPLVAARRRAAAPAVARRHPLG